MSSITIPAFAVAGSDRFIFVGAGGSAPAAPNITSVVRNGTENFTNIWSILNGTNDNRNSGWFFVNPAVGSFSIQINFVSDFDECCAGAVSLNGVDQGSPIGTHGTQTGSSTTPSVTVTASADQLLCDFAYVFATTIAVGGDQDSRWEQEGISGFSSGGGSTQAGSFDDVMSWTISSAAWTIGAVPVNGTTGATPPFTLPNGVKLRPAIFSPGLAR